MPELYKQRLLKLKDRRISKDGVIIIKAGRRRTQDRNKADALARLQDLISSVTLTRKPRQPTTPTKTAQQQRLNEKTRRSRIKTLRSRVTEE